PDLPKHGRYTELQRLARLVHVPFAQIATELRKHAGDPLAPVTVDEAARDDVVFYLSEHRDEFPGVEIARTYLRHYPYSDLAAQVLGAVGEVSQQQLDSSAGRQFRAGDEIGPLDPRDGSILAMASSPTYSPSVYVGRKPARLLRPLLDRGAAEKANFPGLDRAIEGGYPPGSTFKPVTALAALEEHLISPYDTLSCTGQIKIKGQTFKNWNPYVYEGMTMPVALAASCDRSLYQPGYHFYLP